MASSFHLLAAFFLFSLAFASNSRPHPRPSFKAIYQFGDSLSDTGNLVRWGPMFFPADKLPYGQTYFGKATGRFSDGRLIIDHIASAFDLPFIEAYPMTTCGSFAHGANFAVAGATANDEDFFTQRNVTMSSFKPSISKQLEWFEAHLNSTCRTRSMCSRRFKKTLFIFGEYGGNDYFPAINQGKSLEEVRTFVPHTVATIAKGIRHIVRLGAKRIIAPGPFPFGCLPSILAPFATNDADAYDEFGCLKAYNQFVSYHNSELRRAVAKLNRKFAREGVVIVYADYYGAVMDILRNAEKYGFDEKSLLKACCGTGGDYNYDNAIPCGTEGAVACKHPDRALHWDGVHLTDAAYYRIAKIVIHQLFDKLNNADIDIDVGVGVFSE